MFYKSIKDDVDDYLITIKLHP